MLPEKPPLDGALLEHYGKKGMHWGQRSSYPNTTEIQRARGSVNKSLGKYTRQRNKAVGATIKRAPNAPQQRAKAKKLKVAHLNNPDRVTALRLTKGEAVAHGILAVGITPLVPAVSIAGREVAARHITKKQQQGSYR